MRRQKIIGLIVGCLFFMFVLATPVRGNEVGQNTICTVNILGSALTTLLKGFIQGKVSNIGDAGKMLLYGGIAGYGFYSAKQMISRGNITTGVLTANLSASVCENVSWGESPLAYLGYSLGPARIKIATPLSKYNKAIFNVNVSIKKLVDLAYAISHSNKIEFRYGVLTFKADQKLENGAIGWTKGIFPTTMYNTPDYVLNHEMVHVIQSMQLSCISPYEPLTKDLGRKSKDPKKLFYFEGFKVDLISLANDLSYVAQNYDKSWQEVEAYYFTIK